MTKRYLWAIAVAAVAIVAVVFVVGRQRARTPSATATPAVATAIVRYGLYAVVLEESGVVGAPAGTTRNLAFPSAGVLGDVFVKVGESVTAGERLASLDTRALSLDVTQARAEAAAASAGYGGGRIPEASVVAARRRLEAASSRVAADRAAVTRSKDLYTAGVDALKDVQAAEATLAADEAQTATAQADLRTAGSQPGVAAAQVRAAEARAASAELSLSQGTLTAPASGVVTAIFQRPGEPVDSTKPVLAIGAAQNEVTLSVPGPDARQISPGDAVTLRSSGSPDEAPGRISAIVPVVNQSTQAATVVVTGEPRDAIAGTAVTARITVGHVRGLLVPQSAIVTDPQRGQDVVFIQQRKPEGATIFEQRVVRIGHEDGTTAEISSGLRAGERVATEGAFQLLAPATGGE